MGKILDRIASSQKAVFEDGNKELAHLSTNHHVLCFFKTLVPLIVVRCKAIGNAGLSKGGIEYALKGAKVFIRGGTSDDSEKETQIIALSRRGASIVHRAYQKDPL